ncbi:MAG TPA: hypothetical protein VG755_38765 [Nannocystaceae bacterium]|nr:hypothetical protein [Nannocystaceae bacterium]
MQRLSDDVARTIAAHLVTADRELLAAEGSLNALRRQIERAVASRRRNRSGYPPSTSLVEALTDAQRQAYAAHEETVAADSLLGRPHAGACMMLPDPPMLGERPPADARSRRWYPLPLDLLGVLLWYLRYRPWWSTLDRAQTMLHSARAALREREEHLARGCAATLTREHLPLLDEPLASGSYSSA